MRIHNLNDRRRMHVTESRRIRDESDIEMLVCFFYFGSINVFRIFDTDGRWGCKSLARAKANPRMALHPMQYDVHVCVWVLLQLLRVIFIFGIGWLYSEYIIFNMVLVNECMWWWCNILRLFEQTTTIFWQYFFKY